MARTFARKTPDRHTVDTAADVDAALAWLKKRGTKANRDGMARYAIVADQVFGVSVTDIRRLGKTLGLRHDLAERLWKTGWYEARMLVAFVADPARVTPAQMDRWARDFDNWAICDELTFQLFDCSPHAWGKVDQWAAKDASSSSAPRSRCSPPWRCTTRTPATARSSTGCRSSRRRRRIRATSSRRASAGRCAASAVGTSRCTLPPWRSRTSGGLEGRGGALGREGRAARPFASAYRRGVAKKIGGGSGPSARQARR